MEQDLHRLQRGGLHKLLSLSSNSSASLRSANIAVDLNQLAHVQLRLLQQLNLAKVNIVQGINAGTSALNLLADALRDELAHQLLELAVALALNNLNHLLANIADLK